ncbi:MAG: cytochrome c oxidase accessory protein CcoG [Halobacteriovoraceae bacterium]|nr:cytochrome c oxidase accessory protein CcoG [Halobacteriovoraceae bacterium]|tara:strand:+ start:303004 stop:304398 length:1395 start_codon:yes stop_codon:yes gene_type:complete
MSSNRELHSTRLGTTDEKGRRIMPQPDDVNGKWKNRRSLFYTFLIAVYLILPWIYVDGKQWVLLNIPKREFTLFGHIFHAYDSIYLIFVLLGFMLLIAFITSVWGRAWCGWACPQTVFIDQIYRKIERFVEGNARKRKALNRSPISFEKIFKKFSKWFLYLVVSLHIVHSFLGYFVGTRNLVNISFQAPSENWFLFVTMLILTGITLFDFGWFREQFCIIACPYGRFQSVLMDENSLVVAYDEKRGEPRRNVAKAPGEEGDCIDCFKCVKVCPTGIDIRRGTQMECIACTMCIDACDEIMRKMKRPEGLIKYTSEKELTGQKRKVGIRSFVYLSLLVVVMAGAVVGLSKRSSIKAQFLRMPGPPFTKIVEDEKELYINRFETKVQVIGRKGRTLSVESMDSNVEIVSGQLPLLISKDRESFVIFVKFKKQLLKNGVLSLPLKLIVRDGDSVEETMTEVGIVGPL